MKLSSILLLLLAAVICLSFFSDQAEAVPSLKKIRISLPGIFDWIRYKTAFEKVYPSIKEELARKKLFIANALKVFTHNLCFRWGKTGHYLSINQFSDYTHQEIDSIYSFKMHEENNLDDENHLKSDDKVAVNFGASEEEVEQGFSQLIAEKRPGFEILSEQLLSVESTSHERVKRALTKERVDKQKPNSKNSRKKTRRNIHLDEFRSSIEDYYPEESAKYVRRVPSTNPDYAPVEIMTQGSNQEEIRKLEENQLSYLEQVQGMEFVKSKLNWLTNALSSDADDVIDEKEIFDIPNVRKDIGGSKSVKSGGSVDHDNDLNLKDDVPGLEDRVYYDLRESGCLTVVKNQRRCGSCYAFAMTGLMEWWHCHDTGKLVPLSEQYIVDCGPHVNMEGCDGANLGSMGKFMKFWGTELAVNYPYRARNGTCPYTANDWQKAGYKKPLMLNYLEIRDRNHWSVVLEKFGPMLVAVFVPTDFSYYGGGVHRGRNCGGEDDGHAMLIVGHGIEDGEEYWLMRNSHGYYWGENGYFKLSKNADKRCIYQVYGSAFDFNVDLRTV